MAKLRYPLVATKKYPPPALFAASGSVPGHHLPRFWAAMRERPRPPRSWTGRLSETPAWRRR